MCVCVCLDQLAAHGKEGNTCFRKLTNDQRRSIRGGEREEDWCWIRHETSRLYRRRGEGRLPPALGSYSKRRDATPLAPEEGNNKKKKKKRKRKRKKKKREKKKKRGKPLAVHRTEILKCAATITSFDGLLIAARQEQQGESKREIIKIRATSSADDRRRKKKVF